MYEMSVLQYEMDYAAYSKLESRPQDLFRIESTQYGEKVTVELSFDPDKENDVVGILTNITNGKGKIIKLSKKFLTKPD